jgi:hypothetical protein
MKTHAKRRGVVVACLVGLTVIVAITLACIISISKKDIARANAARLAEDTKVVHDARVEYSENHGHEPKCLDQLVTGGYLNSIPRDFLSKVTDLGVSEHCE